MSRDAQIMKRQQALADFGELALRSDELDEILAEACRLVGEALGTGRAKVLEIQHGEQSLLVRAGVGWDPGIVGHMRLPMGEASSETFSIREARPVVSRDIRAEQRFEIPAFMKDAGVVALANVPILLPGGRPFGLLQVDSREPRDFGEEDTHFLRTYAAILGPVIDRVLKIRDLRASEERFRLTVGAARDYAIFVSDPRDRITDWLPGAVAVFGWTADEAIGQSAAMLFTPEDRAQHEDAKETAQACAEGVAPNVRWHCRKDGSRVFIEGSTRALRDADGTLTGFLKIGQDVTRRRETEERLRASEARQRALIEGLPQLVWRCAGVGLWTWASPQWTAYTGQRSAGSLGRGWLDVLHPEDRDAAMQAWRDADANGRLHAEWRVLDASSGQYHWFQMRGTPLRDQDGGITEWIGTSTDIHDQVLAREVLARSHTELEARVAERTAELQQAMSRLHREIREREQAEEQLRQSEKLKVIGQLTGGIAHDFNNMLQAITSSLSMIRYRIQQGRTADVAGYVDRAERVAKRAATLTHRLLAFGRRQTLAPRPVSFNRIARDMEDMIRRTVGPAVQVELKLAEARWLGWCDPNQLESALLNLCVNARDAMPDGGWLIITTDELTLSEADMAGHEDARPGRYVAIAVSDTGTGMPPEVVTHVFEPFFTTKPLGKGTGLGLSQIYGFVRQSGGIVQIETTPGKGTTVRLCLPFHGLNPDADAAGPADNGRTVLLVEDEEDVRVLTAAHLRDLGYRVLEAETGAAALRLVQAAARLDVLISDIGLPGGMNGRQLAEAVRDRHADLPVILITGFAAGAPVPDMELINKPFDPALLAALVERKLDPDRSPGSPGL